jgi:hypothetical protein
VKAKPKTKIILTCGGKGGTGKTTVLVAITDYLRSRGAEAALMDCDTENAQQVTCFAHWLGGKENLLNLRDATDRDRLLTDSAAAGVPYVLVDLPANATGDIATWLQDVATADLIAEMGLEVLAVGVVTPQAGSARSVVQWVNTLGDRASYLVALNRLEYEPVPRPAERVFPEWFEVALPMLAGKVPADRIHTIDVPNMEAHGMHAMVQLGKLPSKAIQDPSLHLLHKKRVKTWRDKIFAELDKTGLFPVQSEPTAAAKS